MTYQFARLLKTKDKNHNIFSSKYNSNIEWHITTYDKYV